MAPGPLDATRKIPLQINGLTPYHGCGTLGAMETTARHRRAPRLAQRPPVQARALHCALWALEDANALSPGHAGRARGLVSIDWCSAHPGTPSDQLRAVLAESL